MGHEPRLASQERVKDIDSAGGKLDGTGVGGRLAFWSVALLVSYLLVAILFCTVECFAREEKGV